MPPALSMGQPHRNQENPHSSSTSQTLGVSSWRFSPRNCETASPRINLISLFFSDICHWQGKSKTDIRDFLAGWQPGSEQDFAGGEHSTCALKVLNARFPLRFRSLHSPSGLRDTSLKNHREKEVVWWDHHLSCHWPCCTVPSEAPQAYPSALSSQGISFHHL